MSNKKELDLKLFKILREINAAEDEILDRESVLHDLLKQHVELMVERLDLEDDCTDRMNENHRA